MSDCISCMDSITDENMVYYKLKKEDEYAEYDFCKDCTIWMLENQWQLYMDTFKKVDCIKEFINLMSKNFLRTIHKITDYKKNINESVVQIKIDNKEISTILKNSFDEQTFNEFMEDLNKMKHKITKENAIEIFDNDFVIFMNKYITKN